MVISDTGEWSKVIVAKLMRAVQLTLILLVANLAKTKSCKKTLKKTETLGPHPRVLRESYPENTNMTGFR